MWVYFRLVLCLRLVGESAAGARYYGFLRNPRNLGPTMPAVRATRGQSAMTGSPGRNTSCGAVRPVMPDVEHRSHKGLKTGPKILVCCLRKRERALQGFGTSGRLSRASGTEGVLTTRQAPIPTFLPLEVGYLTRKLHVITERGRLGWRHWPQTGRFQPGDKRGALKKTSSDLIFHSQPNMRRLKGKRTASTMITSAKR